MVGVWNGTTDCSFLRSKSQLRTVQFGCRKPTFIFCKTSQPGPCAAREKFNAVFEKQSFLLQWSALVLEFGVPRGQGVRLQGHACVNDLPWVGVEVCAKFGADWFGGSGMKEDTGTYIGSWYKQSVLYILANRAPALPGKNLMSLHHPSGHFKM